MRNQSHHFQWKLEPNTESSSFSTTAGCLDKERPCTANWKPDIEYHYTYIYINSIRRQLKAQRLTLCICDVPSQSHTPHESTMDPPHSPAQSNLLQLPSQSNYQLHTHSHLEPKLHANYRHVATNIIYNLKTSIN